MNSDQNTPEINMNPDDLYHEETFTDRHAGSIRRLTPVTREGQPDNSRRVLYIGQAQLMTPMGALPLSFEIEASSLDEAIAQYSGAAQQATNQAMEELKEMRREAASSIVTPESAGQGGLGGGGFQLR